MTSKAIVIVMLTFAGAVSALEAQERVDFNFQIRPILSDRCFKCHGPDEKARKANLRLDTPEGAFAVIDKKDGRRAIVPKKPNASEVVKRITSTDPDEVMPPSDSHLQLSKEEIALLQKWIEQGAEYRGHWSFIPLEKIKAPKIASGSAVRNDIDRFVLARLQREGLKPSPEANRETLIRRLSLDLRGLPPSVEEIDFFLRDGSADAYERLVDRLLASPAYGERMANDWLDLARYADTYGYQADVDRDMYPWRDWVIRAFNQNLPYDQFIIWQIAGDLLPNATDEQILATAFNRLHRQTNEGGSIEEEFRTEYNADRVHTFGTAFLGLTLECARCHDHKYDPIKQRDYYRLFAFFNNIDESGLYSHFTQATPSPSLLLYGDGQKEKHLTLKKRIAEQEAKLARIASSAKGDFGRWLSSSGARETSVIRPHAAFAFDQINGDKTTNAFGTTVARLVEGPQQTEGRQGKALKFDGENSVICDGIAHFKRTDEFSFSLWLKPTEEQPRAVVFHHSRAWTDSGSRGYELVLERGKPTFALIHFWPGNAIGVRMRDSLALNEWTRLTITYDGSSRAGGIHIYRNGETAEVEIVRDNLFKDILHRGEWGDADAGNINLILAARFRDSGFKNGLIDEFQIFDRCLTAYEIRAFEQNHKPESNDSANSFPESGKPVPPLPKGEGRGEGKASEIPHAVSKNSKQDIFTHFLNRHCNEYQNAVAELKKFREEENNFVNDIREIMVMKELSWRRPTYLLKRGAYDAPGEPVEPGTPDGIFPFPKNFPKNRLGLARWLVDKRNPLTARVVVNRLWKLHFGRGLIVTPEDFGSQGQLPVHPELLDRLANYFVESGWDVKKLRRLIVMSATYRQTSVASPELTAVDPENRLLARGPKHRLAAEQIRDAALAVSGLLSSQIGGPSVKPYQPAGLWEQSGLSKTYVQDKGEKLYRRSLYTFWRRTAPPPTMLTFDATAREVCTAKREVTATPLQALVLLNDSQFVEASRVLAEKLMQKNGDTGMLVENGFRMVTGRTPQTREREILLQLYGEQLELFKTNAAAAEKFLATGEYPNAASIPKPELAAATVLMNTLMNHDEFVMKR